MNLRALLILSASLALTSCDDGSGSGSGGGGSTSGSNPTTATTTTTGVGGENSGQADTTSAPADPCHDSLHGNNQPTAAYDLGLDTSDTVSTVIGSAADPLVVCNGDSDYFWFDADCASYVSIEVRALGGDVPADILLYDSTSITPGYPPIDSSEGTFARFFLRPLQRKIDAGTHVVRTAVNPQTSGPLEYTLTVTVFPTSECS